MQEGAVTIRDLVRHALRHQPDHIVVAYCAAHQAARHADTTLDRTAERTNHRLQAIIKALKQRDKETIAIEARLRQTMIDRIGDPQGVPADDESANGTLTLTNDQESRADAE